MKTLAAFVVLTFAVFNAMAKPLTVVPGDILVQQSDDGAWHVVRILEVDQLPHDASTAHCLTYEPRRTKPDAASARNLPVRIWHAPILASSFNEGWERIGNQPVAPAELKGFADYLKLTDFPRYLRVTGQDPKKVIAQANERYTSANTLADQGKRSEAIAEYTRAIELFPLFFEAIDNRAFMHMELGRYEEALQDFEMSLRVNPDGVTAFFSRGECLMKLGKLSEAEAVFKEGTARFPQQRDLFDKFLSQVRSMQRKG